MSNNYFRFYIFNSFNIKFLFFKIFITSCKFLIKTILFFSGIGKFPLAKNIC